ncbi:Uncharacterized protein DAT39_014241 [Clarias magur]|uniref:Uncharacterized protein n=1 Tax=Clarias magur TaxID=1594786 RepID=A0A8J4TET2_CLAMG|nr:Uncharacterized protein DAT39_014241 [Clarias magur]
MDAHDILTYFGVLKVKHSGMSQCTSLVPEVHVRRKATRHFILLSTFAHLFTVPEDILIVSSMVRKMSGLRKNRR